MSLVKVEGFSNLRKDTSEGGVVNVDKTSYSNYLMTRNAARLKAQEIESTKQSVANITGEINSIKSDITDIKNILLTLINK
jgi:hypothetical protein